MFISNVLFIPCDKHIVPPKSLKYAALYLLPFDLSNSLTAFPWLCRLCFNSFASLNVFSTDTNSNEFLAPVFNAITAIS